MALLGTPLDATGMATDSSLRSITLGTDGISGNPSDAGLEAVYRWRPSKALFEMKSIAPQRPKLPLAIKSWFLASVRVVSQSVSRASSY